MIFHSGQEIIQDELRRLDASGAERLQALAGRHLVLTGARGPLGMWILEVLHHLNRTRSWKIRVTAISREASKIPERWNHLADPLFRYRSQDIRYLAELPADSDHVIHAAALTDRRWLGSNPSLVGSINVLGTTRVLEAAARTEALRSFVHLSSGLVLGRGPEDRNLAEDDFGRLPPPFGADVYVESKRCAECLVGAYASESKLPVVILRPFATIGPYQALDLPWAVTDFIREALAGGPIRLLSDGSAIRSFLYLPEFAFWVLVATLQAATPSVYHVGSDEPISLLALAEMIAQQTIPRPGIRTGLGRTPTRVHRLVPDLSKIQRELKLSPSTPLVEAIQRTVRWHQL